MTKAKQIKGLAWLALLGSASLLAACAGTGSEATRLNVLQLGRNATGDPCRAVYGREDPTLGGPFDSSFAITCRGATSGRSVGFIRSTPSADTVAKIEATLACGAPRQVEIKGVGPAQARRCTDATLGTDTVVLIVQRGDRNVIGTAPPALLGVLEDGMRQLAVAVDRSSPDRQTEASIQVASLAAPPSANSAATSEVDFDPAVALRTGTELNQRGLHSEASRLLNDALSRTGPDVPAATRAELYLEAALADSNIRFPESAAERFARAEQIIAAEGVRDTVVLRKRDTFRALDLLNRRQFRASLAALDRLLTGGGRADQPLTDPAVLGALNQPGRNAGDAAGAIAAAQEEQRLQLLLNTQAHWARSVALRTLGEADQSRAALDQAFEAYNSIGQGGAQQAQILWLKARLERQAGRLAAARQDWAMANRSFDNALAALGQAAAINQWTGREPTIADAQLERASVLAQQGAPKDVVRKQYTEAVDAMIASKAAGSIGSGFIERYLDLLVEESAQGPREDTAELYFRALQAIGEPAVARQLNQLQSAVTADPELGVKFRDRADLERDLTALRYRIDSAPEAERAPLERERTEKQARLQQLENELAGNARASSVDDRPASIAEIRATLRPGEAYFKITPLNRRAYGLVVDKERAQVYSVRAGLDTLSKLATDIRNSIDGGLKQERRQIRSFEVNKSYALFELLTGPARDSLLGAKAIVVEPSGPLERLPLGVLVTDRASVDRYRPRSRSTDVNTRFDYSDLAFLASRAELSTSLSPRTFLVARSRQPSEAQQPFIGFAEHSPESVSNLPGSGNVTIGSNACFADAGTLRQLMEANLPINRQELSIATTALGVPQAPTMAGLAFTDQAVEARADLDQFQVLHFATHGLEEGVFGCRKSPPALLTSIGESGSDGLLSFDEIARLRLDANLVVLSACDTASGVRDEALARQSGQEEGGSTLEGLVRAFLTANSRAVLATYWQVSAAAETNDLVRTFYTSARRENIGASLRTAQQQLMRNPEFSHPFYWGAYFVVGDSSKMMLSQPVQQASRQTASR